MGASGAGLSAGDWSPQEMARAEAILTAERARQDDLREMREWLSAAHAEVDAAATVMEALNLASFVQKDLDRWAHTRPGPDDAGLRWLIAEYERAERAGRLICVPVDDDEGSAS